MPCLISKVMISLLLCTLVLFVHFTDAGENRDSSAAGIKPVSQTTPKSILVLYSYGYGFPVQQQLAAGFNSVITSQKLRPENVFHEYLDIIPPRTPDQKKFLRDLLLNKYSGKRFDLIITVGDAAPDFILNEGRDISPGSPVMAFVAREPKQLERAGERVRFIQFKYDIQGTLELALKLFPKTRRVVFMAGQSGNDLKMEELAKKVFATRQEKLEFEYTSHLSVEEMQQRVKQLPADSIVIFSVVSSDKTGRTFIPKDLLKAFAQESNAPFFGLVSTYLGTGIVGGSIMNIEAAGAMAGRAAVDVLEGKTPNIEPSSSFIKPMFDWKQIERWNCDVSRLSGDTVYINRQLTLWGQYKAFVIGTLIVILILVLFSLALVMQIRRRISAEKELRESETYFRTIFDASNEAMIIHEVPSGAVVDINQTMCEMYGYSLQEALKLTVSDISSGVPPYTDLDVLELIRKAASGMPQLFEWHARDKNGRLFWVEVKLKLVTLNRTERVVATMRDISERKQMEAQLIQLQKMESIGRLAGGIAHDFNNMLSVILGYTELSKLHLSDPDRLKQNLDEILKAAEHSRNITRQLLAFSRKEIISPKPVDLNRHIVESEKNLARMAGEDIIFSFRPAPDLWNIKIDPTQLDQILINLLVNSRDAMPDGGQLMIETANLTLREDYCYLHLEATPGEYVQLSVSDTGIGMDSETLKHIFEPFFTTKDLGKGTGLGLATVYGIITQNHGFINVYSEPGHGTTFRIFFPRAPNEADEEGKKPSPDLSGRENGTILLVEDDPMVSGMAENMLTVLGYQVISAKNPQEAIAVCKNGNSRLDLVLTDVVMPEMNGREMAEKLGELRPGIRVLYMSGYTSDLIAQRGIIEGNIHFIQKPFDLLALHAKIKEALA